MKEKILYLLCLLSFATTTLQAQESTLPTDYGFPENTIKAQVMYATFNIPQQHFVQKLVQETYIFYKGRLTKYQYQDKTNNRNTEQNYTYENSQLKSMEMVQQSISGMEYITFKYRKETEGNKTTLYKIYPTGEVEKTLEFRNETGELRGTTYYDKNGNKTKYTEYGRKKGHRTKKYNNNQPVSDILYLNNKDGKLAQIIEHTVPENEAEPKVLKTINYNERNDPVKILQYYPTKDDGEKKLHKTYYTDYLYDGDVWVTKIEYNNDTEKLDVTIRTIVTTNRTYKPQDDKQIISFCKQAYQNYLKMKK